MARETTVTLEACIPGEGKGTNGTRICILQMVQSTCYTLRVWFVQCRLDVTTYGPQKSPALSRLPYSRIIALKDNQWRIF